MPSTVPEGRKQTPPPPVLRSDEMDDPVHGSDLRGGRAGPSPASPPQGSPPAVAVGGAVRGAAVPRPGADGAAAGLRAPADPLLPALVDLLLPQRDGLLERVDRVLAGGERVGAVRRGDGDHDARAA